MAILEYQDFRQNIFNNTLTAVYRITFSVPGIITDREDADSVRETIKQRMREELVNSIENWLDQETAGNIQERYFL